MARTPTYRVGQIVRHNDSPGIITQILSTGSLVLTLFPPHGHPCYILAAPEDVTPL
jgi:hypothetical protein